MLLSSVDTSVLLTDYPSSPSQTPGPQGWGSPFLEKTMYGKKPMKPAKKPMKPGKYGPKK